MPSTIRIIILLACSSLWAADAYKIEKGEDKRFYLIGEGVRHEINSSAPKLMAQKEENGLTVIDYFQGEFGTSRIIGVYNRVLILEKEVIVDAPFRYVGNLDPIWKVDTKKRTIKIKDPESGSRTVNY